MRKFYTILLTLFTVTSVAMAQPAMTGKGYINNKLTEVDTLCRDEGNRTLTPEIWLPDYMQHFQHPTAIVCSIGGEFSTTEQYTTYEWVVEDDYGYRTSNDEFMFAVFSDHPGYIKVIVQHEGDVGTDSIEFCPKQPETPIENFLMKIDENGYPIFSGTVTTAERLQLRAYSLIVGDDTPHMQNQYILHLTPGEWEYKDESTHLQEDIRWIYNAQILDTCTHYYSRDIPGLLLNTRNINEEWVLDMMTIFNTEAQLNSQYEFAYIVYSVDENGQRHHFTDGNGPVILPKSTTSWTIPGPHVDPYYQIGVAWVHEDGTIELVSLSNMIDNPLLDPTGIEEDSQAFMVYPNPAQGRFTVEGTGKLTISNMVGQTILNKEIDGKTTIELPQGLYFVKLGGETRKIVVE